MDYPLIKKWLGLEVVIQYSALGNSYYVIAGELEKKLSEGFEVYYSEGGTISRDPYKFDRFMSLAIGKQPIKKQTQAEAALEFVKNFKNKSMTLDMFEKEANKVLEMEE